MRIISDLDTWYRVRGILDDVSIGFVATMGALAPSLDASSTGNAPSESDRRRDTDSRCSQSTTHQTSTALTTCSRTLSR